jgi:hypothetical protein
MRVGGAVLFCLVIFLSGFWLSRSGKPYNAIAFNLHKLIAVAAVVFFVITLLRINRVAALNTSELIAGILSSLFFLVLIITGALLSINKPMPAMISKLHHLIPYLALFTTALTLYLLLIRKL